MSRTCASSMVSTNFQEVPARCLYMFAFQTMAGSCVSVCVCVCVRLGALVIINTLAILAQAVRFISASAKDRAPASSLSTWMDQARGCRNFEQSSGGSSGKPRRKVRQALMIHGSGCSGHRP